MITYNEYLILGYVGSNWKRVTSVDINVGDDILFVTSESITCPIKSFNDKVDNCLISKVVKKDNSYIYFENNRKVRINKYETRLWKRKEANPNEIK